MVVRDFPTGHRAKPPGSGSSNDRRIEVLADPDFDTDMDRLMRSLAGYLEARSEPR